MTSVEARNFDCKPFVIENNIIIGKTQIVDVTFKNVGQFIIEIMQKDPHHIALVEAETGKKMTFGEMQEKMIKCAVWLQTHGIKQGDVVVVIAQNQFYAYIPVVATYLVGAASNPWYHEITPDSAAYFMRLTRPKVVFVQESMVQVVVEFSRKEKVEVKIVVFEESHNAISLNKILSEASEDELKKFHAVDIDSKWVSMIFFSSGTTGFPKAIELPYGALNYIVGNLPISQPYKQVGLWYSSLYCYSGWFSTIISLIRTNTRILHLNFSPEDTCRLIEKYEINWFFVAPTQLINLNRSGVLDTYKLKSLRQLLTGGAKLQPDIFETLKLKLPHTLVTHVYATSEVGCPACLSSESCTMPDSIGFVQPNIKLKIVDPSTGNVLGPNEDGEIYLKTPTMMNGYCNNTDATKAAFDDEGWYRSGDMGYYLDNGELFFSDRLKEIMKFQGRQVSPNELEEILSRHPAVVEVVVVPLPHEIDIERPMAFVKKASGYEVTAEELIEMSASMGDHKKLWGGVKFVENLPRTPTGKVDRKAVKEMAKTLYEETSKSQS